MTASALPPSRHERRVAARRQAKAQQRARRAGRGKRLAVAFGAAATVGTGLSITHLSPASAVPLVPTITVTNLNDSGAGSLRQAIDDANFLPDADVIGFQASLFQSGPGQITLAGYELQISQSVTIDGPGAGLLTVNGDNSVRPFHVKSVSSTPIDVTFDGLTISQGYSGGDGGGIFVEDEHVTITGVVLSSNHADSDGGAIAVATTGSASLALTSSTVSGNAAMHGFGGGISVQSPGTLVHANVAITDSTIEDSSAPGGDGGGLAVRFASGTELIRSTVSGNTTGGRGGGIFTEDTTNGSDGTYGSYYGLTVVNSTIAENGAVGRGGAMAAVTSYTAGVAAAIRASTIAANTSNVAESGGFDGTAKVKAAVGNAIIADNEGAGSPGDFTIATGSTGGLTFGSVLIEAKDGDTPILSGYGDFIGGVDPQLGALTIDSMSANGTKTMKSALASTRDVGLPADVFGTLDQRGLPRTSGTGTDLGAVELQAPGVGPTVTLKAASDLGSSNSDGVTSATGLTFTISGAQAGANVVLYQGGQAVFGGSRTGNGDISISDPGAGTYVYTARQTIDQLSADGDDITVVVDHTAPAAPGVPDLAAASDVGTSDTDDLTSATTREFALTGVESTATVQLSQWTQGPCIPIMPGFCFPSPDIHTAVGSPRVGNGSVTESSQPGTATPAYEARQTDLAGNAGAYSSRRTVTLDFAAPSVPNAPDLQAASDNGTSSSDNSTTLTSLTFDVTGIDSDATATLARVDGQSGDEVDTRAGDGAMTDAGPVPAGSHTYVVSAMDPAGNMSVDPNGLAVTVVAVTPPPPLPSTTTTTAPPSTTSTTDAPPPPTASAKASDSTPNAGDTIKLETAPPSGGSTSSTLDSTKPSTAILLSTNGDSDRPMPQPVITRNADGSVSISVTVPADTPPGVYLIAVMGTTPSGESRVIIVPVVVRRIGAAVRTRATTALVSATAVPAVARSIQASVAALGGSAAVERAVVEHGASLSIVGDQLVVDSHPAGSDSPVGPAAVVGLLLGAIALLRTSTRRFRSIR